MKESRYHRNRANAVYRDWTQGNIFRNLVSLSWPIIVGNSFNLLGPLIDMVWVGKLGPASIAGVGVASMAVMMVTSTRMGLTMGTRAMVARFVGAGDAIGANHVAQQAFVLSAIFSITMASIGIFLTEPILALFGLEPDVIAEGADYMRIMFVGTVAMSFRMMAEGIMQSSGDTFTPMRVNIFFRIFHAALAPFLIFGLWIFPRLGVAGAATTNVISQGLGGTIGFWILFSGRSRLRITLKNFRINLNIIWRIVKIGIPSAIMTMERSLADMVLLWFMAPFGTVAVAGHTIIQRFEMVLRMPCMGLGHGSSVLVGQNLGAREPERAERSGWLAGGLAEVYSLIIVVAILLWAEGIISIFNTDPEVVQLSSSFLRIASVGYLFMGLYFVMQNAIAGAGDTLPPMLVTLLNFWLLQIPLAFFLPRFTVLGVYGVRWAIVAGWIAGAFACSIYFRLGMWKHKMV